MTTYKGQITGLASPFLESRRMNIIKKYVTGGNILDFGCGTGKLAGLLSFDEYMGVDIDLDSINAAKAHYSKKENIVFISIEEYSQIERKFDFIILSAVIEHFDNPHQNLKELSNRLNAQGKMIITTPTGWGNKILSLGSKLKIFSKKGFEEHNYIFSKTDFVELANFLNLNLREYRTFEYGLNQLVILSK
jgi:2-polyprenyl-3-methyl-5-hydroxy-6-metoxy-1,4-benzoquinol methylase